MDFFERVLHVSPDGGSGATEWSYLLLLLLGLAAVLAIRFRTRIVRALARLR